MVHVSLAIGHVNRVTSIFEDRGAVSWAEYLRFVRIVRPDVTYTNIWKFQKEGVGQRDSYIQIALQRRSTENARGRPPYCSLTAYVNAHAHFKLDNQPKNLCISRVRGVVCVVRMRVCRLRARACSADSRSTCRGRSLAARARMSEARAGD